ncbi:MAG: peptidase M50 [Enterocloster clostridioformis]
MNRNIKGGFLTLSGVVGIVGMIIVAMQNPSTSWVTPPGRMIVSILEKRSIDSFGFLPCSFCLWIVYSFDRAKKD